MIKIFIISLSESRFLAAKSRLDRKTRAVYQIEWVRAVDGNKLTAREYYQYASAANSRPLLSPPELGCTLSHFSVWTSSSFSASPALVLEDDFIWDPQDSSLSNCLSAAFDFSSDITDPIIIHLCAINDFSKNVSRLIYCSQSLRLDKTRQLRKLCYGSSGLLFRTTAYIINPSAATNLAKMFTKAPFVADRYDLIASSNPTLAIYCSPLFRHPIDYISTIQNHLLVKPSYSVDKLFLRLLALLANRARFFLSRFRWKVFHSCRHAIIFLGINSKEF